MEVIDNGQGMVVIVNGTESFLVNGLKSKMAAAGINTIIVGRRIKDVENYRNSAKLFILFMDDSMNEYINTIKYLKEIASDKLGKLLLIGEQTQYDYIIKIIEEPLIAQWFQRPLDMEVFLKAVKSNLEEKQDGSENRKSILIVDDDITYMRTIYEWLKDEYNVGMASSGLQAIGYLTKNKTDLVLLDYEMPVINGPQIMEIFKSDSETSIIPVMFLTGHGDKESVMSVINLKPVDYLLKTIDKSMLLAKLRAYFLKHGGNDSSES